MPRTDPDHIPYKDRPVLGEESPADHASDDIVVEHVPTDEPSEGGRPPRRGLFARFNAFLAGLPKAVKLALWVVLALLLFLLPLVKVPILDTPGADFAPGHGSHHDLDGERWVRISLAGATSDMDEALTRLARWVGA